MSAAVRLTDKQKQVQTLTLRDGPNCFWCGRLTHRKQPGQTKVYDHTATRDHVIPKSAGGTDALWNLVLACFKCNADRADLPAEAFAILRHRTPDRLREHLACVSIDRLSPRGG